MQICLTFDTDWATEETIQDTLDILSKFDIKATFFTTGYYKAFEYISDNIEIGLHPNYNSLFINKRVAGFDKLFDDIYQQYPKSKGFRSHSLVQGSAILSYAKSKGLLYDSNNYNPHQAKVYKDYSGLYRFTHCWVDYGLLLDKKDIAISAIPLKENADNIIDFHPIHIYLNTHSAEYYNNIKQYTTDAQALKSKINTSQKGIRDLFIEMLNYIQANQYNTYTLFELYQKSL